MSVMAPRIVIAPDSFKESCAAADVALAIEAGILQRFPHARCVRVPVADGGEGTLAAIEAACGGQRRSARVEDAMGRPRLAEWLLLPDGTALIELAAAAGLEHVPPTQRDPWRASTFGVGQLMQSALAAGCRRLMLTLGGSATNDAGAGMLQALGLGLLNARGEPIARGLQGLSTLAAVDAASLHPALANTELTLAVDVQNPLCGVQGASAVYGPQKGLPASHADQADAILGRFARLTAQQTGRDCQNTPGTGAAGGTAFAAVAWCGAHLRPGFEIVAELTGLARQIAGADLVFTAEGSLDGQTAAGKAPAGVICLARQAGVPVVALCGALKPGYETLHELGLTAAFSITAAPMALEAAYAQTRERLSAVAREVVSLRWG